VKRIILFLLLILSINSFAGEKVTIEADSIKTPEKSVYHAIGNVKIFQGEKTMLADEIYYYKDRNFIDAIGNVQITENGDVINCSRMEYDAEKETGIFYQTDAFMQPYQWFTADKTEKLGENSYLLNNARFSTCEGPNPDWSFTASEAEIQVGGYLKAKHTAGWLKNVPLFYTPYFIYPVKTERETGFLVPDLGFSSSKGAFIQPKYFWNIDVDKDATFAALLSSTESPLYALETRFTPSQDSNVYNYIEYSQSDKKYPGLKNGQQKMFEESNRYRIYNRSRIKVSDRFYILTKIESVSDYDYIDDYSDYSLVEDIDGDEEYTFNSSLNMFYYAPFASLTFKYSDDMEYGVSSSRYSKQHTYIAPTISAEKNITNLPVMLKYYVSYDKVRSTAYRYYYSSQRESHSDINYQRNHASLKLYKPLNIYVGTFTPSIKYMHTNWFDLDDDYIKPVGDRISSTAMLDVSGDRITRKIYTQQHTFRLNEIYKQYGGFRHSIYNSLTYIQTPKVNQAGLFDYIYEDDIDTYREYRYAITNYLTSKNWQIKIENSQNYNMLLDKHKYEILTSKFNYRYKKYFYFDSKHEYDHYENDADYLSASTRVSLENFDFSIGYVFDKDTSDEENTSVNLSLKYVSPKYDLLYTRTTSGYNKKLSSKADQAIDDMLQVTYKSDCWQFGLAYIRRSDSVNINGDTDEEVEHIAMFTIGLRGLGEFSSSVGVASEEVENGDN
jgi:LPS-assembly protein